MRIVIQLQIIYCILLPPINPTQPNKCASILEPNLNGLLRFLTKDKR